MSVCDCEIQVFKSKTRQQRICTFFTSFVSVVLCTSVSVNQQHTVFFFILLLRRRRRRRCRFTLSHSLVHARSFKAIGCVSVLSVYLPLPLPLWLSGSASLLYGVMLLRLPFVASPILCVLIHVLLSPISQALLFLNALFFLYYFTSILNFSCVCGSFKTLFSV